MYVIDFHVQLYRLYNLISLHITLYSMAVIRLEREGAALRRGVAGVAGCHWAGWSSLLAVQRTCYRAPREDTVGFQSSRCATSS